RIHLPGCGAVIQTLRLPEPVFGRTLRIRGLERLSDEKYWAFCLANPDTHIERTASREIVIAPPEGGESAYRNTEAGVELGLSADLTRRGKSGLPPDAGWVSTNCCGAYRRRSAKVPPVDTRVHKLKSSRSRKNLQDAKAKMEIWVRNGVELGWLIDGN